MRNIFLIGMPSSGKTTLGKELARHIRYRFLDTDRLIIKSEGIEINDIFSKHGEDYFRELEKKTLHGIRPDSKLIISTGGGMPCFFDNMDFIKKNGISIFLDVSVRTIYDRMLRNNANDRPLFKNDDEELYAKLLERHKTRYPMYSQADFVLKGSPTVFEILKLIEPQLSGSYK